MVTLKACLLLLVSSGLAFCAAPGARSRRRGTTPTYPHDKDTTSYCTRWLDYNDELPCDQVLQANFITLEQFQRWNPSITGNCDGMTVGKSYCVEAAFEPAPTASPTGPSGPTGTPGTIETPLPTQPEIVDNCDKFHLVEPGENCAAIKSKYGISLAQFTRWNPSAGSDCSGLRADAYACVSIVGHEPSKTTSSPSQPTPTKPSNGIETPLPTQPKIVDNCDKFHLVEPGENCAAIKSKYGISLAQFTRWNPSAGSDCSSLWANAYVCVSIIGHESQPSPTKPPNSIQTPTPTQNGMVNNCNKFHFVEIGNICPIIQAKYKVTLANLVKWNPAIRADCTGLWAGTYLCVGTI
ncbi:hypothetical protein MauCBS54593_005552 [Microsporum audouinii]